MRRIKNLLSNVNVMNVLLAGLLVFVVNYMAFPFSKMNTKYTLPPVKKPAIEGTEIKEKTEDKSPSLSDYLIIADQNLFHPERIIPVPKVEAPPLPKPDFVLYGTLVTESVQIAYMGEKKAKGPQDKKQTALRLGDSMSGFILKEVEKDQALMQRGEEKIIVSLNDAKTRESVAPAGAGTAAVTQTPGQPAQAVQKKPPSLAPAQQERQQRRAAARENGKAVQKSPSPGTSPTTSSPSGRRKTSGGGWFGSGLSQ